MFFDFAYIDPGTGSLFLQVVIGGLLGGLFIFRRMVARMFSMIKKVFRRHGTVSKSKATDGE